MSRFRQWLRRRGLTVVIVVTLVAVAAAVTVALLRSSPSSPDSAWTSEDYVAATTTMQPLTEVTAGIATSALPKTPQYDVRVLPVTDFLTFVADLAPGFASDAVINPDTFTTAVLVGSPGAARITATRFVPEQTDALLDAYDQAGASVTVWSGAAARTAPVTRGLNTPLHATSGTGGSMQPLLILILILVAVSVAMGVTRRVVQRRRDRMDTAPAGARGRRKKDDGAADIPDTRFAHVAGCDEAVDELREMAAFIADPDRFSVTGAKPPRGALLVGPPGTGKTLLARALAGEAGVPFYPVSGSDFVEKYVGVGARRVRDLFAKAARHDAGAIVFIDEIDAVGRRRSGVDGKSNQETEQTLNQILVCMDGFTARNVVVIAATNRPDILDPALTRPGRLDREVQVPLPDRLGREQILTVHADGKPLAGDVDLNVVARRTPGMSGADLARIVNEAATLAGRRGADTVTATDFDEAVSLVAMGRARVSAVITDHDRVVTAWHEAGHTVAAMVLDDASPPVSVSIIPRGPAGGVTWMAAPDHVFLTRRQAYARLVVALSGRAAEELCLDGEFTSGPSGDLQAATQTALSMVTQYGMTGAGLMVKSDGLLSTGSTVTEQTVHAVEDLLAVALDTARDTLAAHRDLFDAVVAALLDRETLTAADLADIQTGFRVCSPPLPAAPADYRRRVAPAPAVPAASRVAVRPRTQPGLIAAAATWLRRSAAPRGRHASAE